MCMFFRSCNSNLFFNHIVTLKRCTEPHPLGWCLVASQCQSTFHHVSIPGSQAVLSSYADAPPTVKRWGEGGVTTASPLVVKATCHRAKGFSCSGIGCSLKEELNLHPIGRYGKFCLCVCVCVCARARARARVGGWRGGRWTLQLLLTSGAMGGLKEMLLSSGYIIPKKGILLNARG